MTEQKKADEKAPEVEKAAEPVLDGVDPYAANGVPDVGLHGNADY
jgi:hypothetical protein